MRLGKGLEGLGGIKERLNKGWEGLGGTKVRPGKALEGLSGVDGLVFFLLQLFLCPFKPCSHNLIPNSDFRRLK